MKKRTTTRHKREFSGFVRDNKRLFPFWGLFLLGAAGGILLYRMTGVKGDGIWERLLPVQGLSGGLRAGLQALGGTCFSCLAALAALFLLGLWSFGTPFIPLIPVCHGMWLGLTEAYYYAHGAQYIPAVALIVLPHGLCTAAVLITACAVGFRMSSRLGRQLLPQASCGGLWSDFRLYCLRFAVLAGAGVICGLLDVLARLLFGRFLTV